MVEPIQLKFCFLGDAFSGKTSLVHRIVHNDYKEKLPTIGCSYESLTFKRNGKNYKINIWDTAGQERYSELVPIYYRSNDVFILCFDLSNEESLNSIAKWLERIDKWSLNKNAIICLVGTKCDISVIPNHKISQLRDKFSFFYCATSSKENIGILELLDWTIDNSILHVSKPISITPPESPPKKSFCYIF